MGLIITDSFPLDAPCGYAGLQKMLTLWDMKKPRLTKNWNNPSNLSLKPTLPEFDLVDIAKAFEKSWDLKKSLL